jgi:hypothetical protein
MLEAIQHRRTQLAQRSIGKLHLGFDPDSTNQTAARCLASQILQQRRLAHPRVAVEHQHPTVTRTHIPQQPIEQSAFGAAVDQNHDPHIVAPTPGLHIRAMRCTR